MSHTHDLATLESFEAIIESHPRVVLDFWGRNCKPCAVFAPLYEQLAEHYPDIYFGKVNAEDAAELAQAFQVRSVPTIMAFKNGDLIFEQPGIPAAQNFEALIQHLLGDD